MKFVKIDNDKLIINTEYVELLEYNNIDTAEKLWKTVGEEKQKLTTEAETKKQEKSESGAKTEERKELHKETKKAVVEEKTIEKPKPIEVNPNLPSWIHQELGSADNKDNH